MWSPAARFARIASRGLVGANPGAGNGIVVARPYSKRPVRLSYELTAAGRELAGAMRLLAQWGARRTGEAPVARHAACGSVMEVRWYCPTCARVVEDGEMSEVRFI